MENHRPAWWQLYILGTLMMGALIWAHTLGLAEKTEMVIQIAVLAVAFGLMFAWLGANGPALMDDAKPSLVYPPFMDDDRPGRRPESPWASTEPLGNLARDLDGHSRPVVVNDRSTEPDCPQPVIVGSVLD